MWSVEDEDVNARIRRQARANALGQKAMERLVLEAHRKSQSLRTIAADAEMTAEGIRKMIARALKAEESEEPTPQGDSASAEGPNVPPARS